MIKMATEQQRNRKMSKFPKTNDIIPLQIKSSDAIPPNAEFSFFLKIVSSRGDVAASAGPIRVHKFARSLQELVRVRAEVVTLGLDQISRQAGASVAIVEGEGSAEARQRYAEQNSIGHRLTQRAFAFVDLASEEVVEEKIGELGILGERLLDVAQELTSNDAASSPHERNASVVQIPVESSRGFLEEHEALCIRDDLGGIQSQTDLLDVLGFIAFVLDILWAI